MIPDRSSDIEEEDEEEEDDEVAVLEEDRVPREWTAQVEPGVQITFVSIPGGAGNDLKRIRFRCLSCTNSFARNCLIKCMIS